MVEPFGHTMHDGSFERVMMQNGRIDEGRELGFAADHFLGLARMRAQTGSTLSSAFAASSVPGPSRFSGHHPKDQAILAQRPWSQGDI